MPSVMSFRELAVWSWKGEGQKWATKHYVVLYLSHWNPHIQVFVHMVHLIKFKIIWCMNNAGIKLKLYILLIEFA